MLKDLIKQGVTVKVCGTCMARCGIHKNQPYFEGAEKSTMAQLAAWVVESDRVNLVLAASVSRRALPVSLIRFPELRTRLSSPITSAGRTPCRNHANSRCGRRPIRAYRRAPRSGSRVRGDGPDLPVGSCARPPEVLRILHRSWIHLGVAPNARRRVDVLPGRPSRAVLRAILGPSLRRALVRAIQVNWTKAERSRSRWMEGERSGGTSSSRRPLHPGDEPHGEHDARIALVQRDRTSCHGRRGESLLGAGRMVLSGTVPSGQHYVANPRVAWIIS